MDFVDDEPDPDACNEGSLEFCEWPQCDCFATVYPWTSDEYVNSRMEKQ